MKIIPWKSKCYDQALLAVIMLRWLGIPSCLSFGVKRLSKMQLKAHAWVTINEHYISGEKGAEDFTVIKMYETLPTSP